jgi:hypothetical protein
MRNRIASVLLSHENDSARSWLARVFIQSGSKTEVQLSGHDSFTPQSSRDVPFSPSKKEHRKDDCHARFVPPKAAVPV